MTSMDRDMPIRLTRVTDPILCAGHAFVSGHEAAEAPLFYYSGFEGRWRPDITRHGQRILLRNRNLLPALILTMGQTCSATSKPKGHGWIWSA